MSPWSEAGAPEPEPRGSTGPEGPAGEAWEELRAAWAALPAPEPAEDLSELARRDPGTARAVELVRGLWSRLEAPPLPVPVPSRSRPRGPARVRRAWRPLAWAGAAAAAALLALLARQLAGPRPGGSAELAGAPDAGSAPHATGARPGTTTSAERDSEEPILVALDERRLEMRSGPVRLVLLHPSSDGPGTRNP